MAQRIARGHASDESINHCMEAARGEGLQVVLLRCYQSIFRCLLLGLLAFSGRGSC